MDEAGIRELADGIQRLYEEEDRGPFPYEDCRYLICLDEARFADLIPDLDLYSSKVAGYCSWAKHIPKLPEAKLQEIRSRITSSFFEEYPQYKILESQITPEDTPDLQGDLLLQERMRSKLLTLLTILLNE